MTMSRRAMRLGLLAAALSTGAVADDAPPPYPWPNGARAAVSLAYDDALPTHLDTAIPALDRHGLRGSFYLVLSADTVRTRLADWRAAAFPDASFDADDDWGDLHAEAEPAPEPMLAAEPQPDAIAADHAADMALVQQAAVDSAVAVEPEAASA